jgi:copper transport protein
VTRRTAVALALLALPLLAPAAAAAHATLAGTVPERGAELARAPAQVEFRFDESVDAALGAVQVFDSHGRAVQQGTAFHPGGSGSRVAVRLPANLPQGGYTATYRVISADSHPVSGGFSFSVGHAAAAGRSVADLLRGQTAGPVTGTAFSVVRAVQYAAIALGLGTLVFLIVCWLPGLAAVAGGGREWADAAEAFAQRTRVLLGVAAGAGAVSGLLAIGLEGAVGEGSSLWNAARGGVIGDVLATRFGVVWAAAVAVWLLVGAWALARPAAVLALRPAVVGAAGLALPRARGSLLVLGIPLLGLILLPALGGHAAVQSPVALLLPANVLHVAAMASWLGGIAVLVLALRAATRRLEPRDRTPLLVAVVGRFSVLAGIAFAVLVVTGAVQGVVEVGSFGALLDTAFGRAVLIKVALFCALVGIGWVNRRRLLPALRAADAAPAHAGLLLRRTLRAELLLGVAVLGVTGALAGYPPSTAVSSGPVSREATVGPAQLQLTADPARIGPNQLHIYLFDSRTGAQYTAAKQVTVTAALPDKHIAGIPFDVRPAGPGHVIGTGTLGVLGDWRLTITVRVSDFDEYITNLTIPIH